MPPTDWDKELAKIDKQLASISDEALLGKAQPPVPAGAGAGAVPAAKGKGGEEKAPPRTSTVGVMARLVLAIALGIAMLFWPYSTRCGVGLFGYLGASAMVVVAGVWTAIWTWRHRSAQAHVLALLLILWGIILGAQQILPRVGYARPDAAHPSIWMCE
jgi:hypothetical protein